MRERRSSHSWGMRIRRTLAQGTEGAHGSESCVCGEDDLGLDKASGLSADYASVLAVRRGAHIDVAQLPSQTNRLGELCVNEPGGAEGEAGGCDDLGGPSGVQRRKAANL